jgi:hypothetical protein
LKRRSFTLHGDLESYLSAALARQRLIGGKPETGASGTWMLAANRAASWPDLPDSVVWQAGRSGIISGLEDASRDARR